VKVHLPSTVLLTNWYQSSLWSGWASRLDDTHIYYVQPEVYSILAKASGYRPPHFLWHCGNTPLVILGNADPKVVKHDGLWMDSLPKDHILTKWAMKVHHQRQDASMKEKWDNCFDEARQYNVRHRELTRKIAKIMDLDMDCHNFTKTTLVHYAFGYMWYWKQPYDPDTKLLAERVIKEWHLQRENHYIEYPGLMDARKVVADRLAASLMTDKKDDGQKGWHIPSWIYPGIMKDYEFIRKHYCDINLYDVKNQPQLPLPQFWYLEKK